MPHDSRDAALTGRAFACACVRDTAAAAGGKGQHADIFDGRQAGQRWDVLLSFGFVVRGSGSGVAVMQGSLRGGVSEELCEGGERFAESAIPQAVLKAERRFRAFKVWRVCKDAQ